MYDIGVRTGGRGDRWLGGVSGGTAGGGALGRLGLPDVGLEGGGGGPKREVWGEVQGVPHDVTGRKRSNKDPGSPGR